MNRRVGGVSNRPAVSHAAASCAPALKRLAGAALRRDDERTRFVVAVEAITRSGTGGRLDGGPRNKFGEHLTKNYVALARIRVSGLCIALLRFQQCGLHTRLSKI